LKKSFPLCESFPMFDLSAAIQAAVLSNPRTMSIRRVP
jgi:hypothetical protein